MLYLISQWKCKHLKTKRYISPKRSLVHNSISLQEQVTKINKTYWWRAGRTARIDVWRLEENRSPPIPRKTHKTSHVESENNSGTSRRPLKSWRSKTISWKLVKLLNDKHNIRRTISRRQDKYVIKKTGLLATLTTVRMISEHMKEGVTQSEHSGSPREKNHQDQV